jgi:uncharacterized membrane protein
MHELIRNMQWTHDSRTLTMVAMLGPFLPLLLTVTSGVVYHLALRGQGPTASPWAFLTVAYAAAFALSALAWFLSGGGAAALDRRVLGGAVLLGAAAIGIELGYFLGYRGGWALGAASLINAGLVATVLALIAAVQRRSC